MVQTQQTSRRHRRSVAAVLLLLTCFSASAAAASPSTPTNDAPTRMRYRRAASSSSTASSSTSLTSSSSAPSATASKSSSSYISVTLPDSFVQCKPATVDFTSVIGSQDESLLGDNQRAAKENSWITVIIRDEDGSRGQHSSVQLPGTATSWTWPQVDLPAGSTFSVIISSFSNQTSTASSSSSAKSQHTTTGKSVASSSTSSTKESHKKRRAVTDGSSKSSYVNSRSKSSSRKQQVLAHSFSRSTVVAGPDNDTSCLKAGDTNSENSNDDNPDGLGQSHKGDHSSRNSTTTKIVAALLGSLVGVFATILAILAWQRRRDSRRAQRIMAAAAANGPPGAWTGQGGQTRDGYANMVQTHDGNGALLASPRDRRSVPVPTWDGTHRNSPSGGWTYMSSLVPGLNPGQPPEFGARGDGTSPQSATEGHFPLFRNRRRGSTLHAPVSRRREEEEEDLPSYLSAQEDIKGLPRYDPALDGGAGLRRHLQEMRALAGASAEMQQSSHDGPVGSQTADSVHGVSTSINPSSGVGGGEGEQDLIQAQQAPAMQTILRYLPSGPDRPYSSLETSQVPAVTAMPPRAEVSQAATLTSLDRRGAPRNRHSDDENLDSPFDDRHRSRDEGVLRQGLARAGGGGGPPRISGASNWSQDSA